MNLWENKHKYGCKSTLSKLITDKFDSVKCLGKQLSVGTSKMPKSKQTLPSTLTTTFTNELMREQNQIWLRNYIEFASVKVLNIRIVGKSLKYISNYCIHNTHLLHWPLYSPCLINMTLYNLVPKAELANRATFAKLKKEKPVYFLKGHISLRIVLHKKVIEITNKTLYSHFWPVSQDLAAS